MSPSPTRPPDVTARLAASGPRSRHVLDDVLDAALAGDLATVAWLVEEAGGADVFGEDAGLVEALCLGHGHAVARADVQGLARSIAEDARVDAQADEAKIAPDARRGEARGLLSRLATALGLGVAPRVAAAPVVLRPTLDTSFVSEPPAGGLGVRGLMRDIFAQQTWMPRVDQLVTLVAPALTPGVYALQRKALGGEVELPGFDEVRARLGAGRSLDAQTRRALSERLAAVGRSVDLERLTIHDGAEADALCRELEAEAFALGDALVFRSGAFRPESLEGLHLLVHELTHVWQQAHGLVDGGVDADPALEREAEVMADRALTMPVEVGTNVGTPTIDRGAPIEQIDGVQSIEVGAAGEAEALQRCGPTEMVKQSNPPRRDPKRDPTDPDPVIDDPIDPDPVIIDPVPDPVEPVEPVDPGAECEACPEPDLEHQTFEPLRELSDKPVTPGQKKVELTLAGHSIKVEVPEAQAAGEIEVTFPPDASPFTALILKKAKLRFDDTLRVLDGEISAEVDLGKFVHVANTTLRVFEDGRIGAEIRGVEVNVADNVHALVDLVIGPEGVWGMCTVTVDQVFVSDLVDVKNGLLHLRVDKTGAISMHGEVTVQVHGIGEADLEVCYVDGKWGGSIAIGRREELEIAPGVVLEEIMVTGCFAPDEWWVRGEIKVRVLDRFRLSANAKYHWKAGEGKWSFEGLLDQFEEMPLVGDLVLYDTRVYAKYEEGVWAPMTFQSRLRHPWVEGGVDEGTWDIENNLWSGHGYCTLTQQLPVGDSGITIDTARIDAYLVDNELTEVHGQAAATFPFQDQPTFELSCLDAVYKVKEESLWATANLRSIRDIRFGAETGFHAVIAEGAGVTALVEDSALTKTLGGLAFEARHADKVLGDGGMHFNWVPGGGVDAGGRFDLRERFGLPEYAAGPLFLLPQPGHFEFQVIASEPQFIEAQGVGFEIAQAAGGLIGGAVSGRFDFADNAGDLSGHARVVKSWTEPLGELGSVTFMESEAPNLEVAIEDNALKTARGQLAVRLDINATEHVEAFTLEGHVDGEYHPETGNVSGEIGAALKTDLSVAIGDSGDRVIIREGSWFTANMIESVPDVFTMQLVVQYLRKGELFLEGECSEATFDFQTGELDFFGQLTLKQDIEKQLGESAYSLALVKDVTNLAVVVRKNALISVGGDVAVELRDGEGPLLAGSLTRADYQIEEGLFSGCLDLELRRDLSWPKAEDAASMPPTLAVTLGRGSHVHGELVDNVFLEAGVELFGRVQYQGKEQAEAYLNGRWNVVSDTYDLDGFFRLSSDLVLGDEAAADASDMTAWALVFEKDSEVTVGVAANVFQPVGVVVKMQLHRGGVKCATGEVNGEYVFGAEGGFNGGVVFDVCERIALPRAGRFDLALTEETHARGTIVGNTFTEGAVDVVLVAREGDVDKARLAVGVTYTGGDEFSGHADIAVLDPIRVGERRMGSAQYAIDLNTKTRGYVGLECNSLTAFDSEVGLDVLRDEAPFAEGNFALRYDLSDPAAAVNATGALRLIGVLELGDVGPYTFALEGGSELSVFIEDGGLAWIRGRMALAASTAREGRFATLVIDGRYEGGSKPKFDGSAAATVHKEHDLGFTAHGYGFFLQPSTGFSIVMKDTAFTEMHGAIGVLARQRSKKKDGMHGDVRMTLGGDAVKQGDAWQFDGHADAHVEGGIRVGAAGADGEYVFWIETGSGIAIDVRANRFVSVEGTLNGRVTDKGKDFLGFDCWVRYAAAENANDPGVIDARGSCKLLGEKELYRSEGFAFSLMPTTGYTALIVVEKNEIMEVGGSLGFRLENANAKPQPLKVSGTAEGHYNNTTGMFSGRGDIRLDSNLEFEMGTNKIVLEKGSGGMTEVVDNRLARLGGDLIGRFDDADGPLVTLTASGQFNAETPELERLAGTATLMRQLKLGPEGNPWIIVDDGLSCEVRMEHNALTYASIQNGKFTVPALRLRGGFDHLTMNAEGPETKYSGAGFLEMEMLKEDKEKGRKLKGRLDIDYREDDTWNARGTVDYNITPYLGGQITAEMDQTLDPVLGGTLVMTKKEMLPARDLFQMQFPIIPDITIPVAGIAGFGFGARGYFGLSALPMTLSARVGVANFRPRQMNVPDFEAEADIDWGLRLSAGAMAYLDARINVLIASASIGIQGTADLAGDALVKAKGKLAGKAGEYSGELGIGLVFAPKVTLKAQPYAKASLFTKEWAKVWEGYEYDLGEVFTYEWGSTYKFGDTPEAPKANSERNAAAMSGGARQDMTRSFDAESADSFGEERASPAVQATEGRPAMESGEDLKNKKEEEEADSMEGLKDDSKDASDIGSVMAAVGNIISQLGQILGSLTFGPIGLVLCLCWKWLSGALKKLYDDWCLVTDYIKNNWDKIKEYLPVWFVSFVEFFDDPGSAVDKWWNADEYTRDAVNEGEHLKAPTEVRGNMVGNLFGGYAGDEDRRAIEEVFAVSKNKGDLVGVIVASEYKVIEYPESWYRHDDWAGSHLQSIYLSMGWQVDPGYMITDSNIYFDRDAARDVGDERAHAAQGVAGAGAALPHAGEIQAAFGAHEVGGVTAHTDESARDANQALGARAYAMGEHVAFGGAPDLHTAAHEAAHVVQQRAGVSGATDAHEAHADAVADAVVAGESAGALLDAGVAAGGAHAVVQKKEDDKANGAAKEGTAKGEGQPSGDEVKAAFAQFATSRPALDVHPEDAAVARQLSDRIAENFGRTKDSVCGYTRDFGAQTFMAGLPASLLETAAGARMRMFFEVQPSCPEWIDRLEQDPTAWLEQRKAQVIALERMAKAMLAEVRRKPVTSGATLPGRGVLEMFHWRLGSGVKTSKSLAYFGGPTMVLPADAGTTARKTALVLVSHPQVAGGEVERRMAEEAANAATGFGFETVVRSPASSADVGTLLTSAEALRPGDELVIVIAGPSESGVVELGGDVKVSVGLLTRIVAIVQQRSAFCGVSVFGSRDFHSGPVRQMSAEHLAEVSSYEVHQVRPDDSDFVRELAASAAQVRLSLVADGDLYAPVGVTAEGDAAVDHQGERIVQGVLKTSGALRFARARWRLGPLARVMALWRELDRAMDFARANQDAGLDPSSGIEGEQTYYARIIGGARYDQLAADHASFTQAVVHQEEGDLTSAAEKGGATFGHDDGGTPGQEASMALQTGALGAGEKHALVIGNGLGYDGASALSGAARDAEQWASRYENEGFEVDFERDLSAAAMTTSIRKWSAEAAADEHRAFYYAGHGRTTGLVGVDNHDVPNFVVAGAVADIRAKPAEVTVVIDACYAGAAVDSASKALLARPLMPKLEALDGDGKATHGLIALADHVRGIYAVVQGQAEIAGRRLGNATGVGYGWDRDQIGEVIAQLDKAGVKVASVSKALDRDAGNSLEETWVHRVRMLELLYQAIQERLRETRAEEAKRLYLFGQVDEPSQEDAAPVVRRVVVTAEDEAKKKEEEDNRRKAFAEEQAERVATAVNFGTSLPVFESAATDSEAVALLAARLEAWRQGGCLIREIWIGELVESCLIPDDELGTWTELEEEMRAWSRSDKSSLEVGGPFYGQHLQEREAWWATHVGQTRHVHERLQGILRHVRDNKVDVSRIEHAHALCSAHEGRDNRLVRSGVERGASDADLSGSPARRALLITRSDEASRSIHHLQEYQHTATLAPMLEGLGFATTVCRPRSVAALVDAIASLHDAKPGDEVVLFIELGVQDGAIRLRYNGEERVPLSLALQVGDSAQAQGFSASIVISSRASDAGGVNESSPFAKAEARLAAFAHLLPAMSAAREDAAAVRSMVAAAEFIRHELAQSAQRFNGDASGSWREQLMRSVAEVAGRWVAVPQDMQGLQDVMAVWQALHDRVVQERQQVKRIDPKHPREHQSLVATKLEAEPESGVESEARDESVVEGGDEVAAEWLQPAAQIQVEVTEARDAKLDANVFGSVVPEYLVKDLAAEAAGEQANVTGVFQLALHWDVQSLGRKDAKPALATTEPETSPEFAGTMARVYQAMASDLMPNELGFAPQSAYWSQALAEMHEKVHLGDYRMWAERFGAQIAKETIEGRTIASGDLPAEMESLRVAVERRLLFESVKFLKGGVPPLPYFVQPTEAHAFGTVAPYLRKIADMILEKGDKLAAEEKASGAGAEANQGASLKPAEAVTREQAPGPGGDVRGPGWDSKAVAKVLGWKLGVEPLPETIGKQFYAHGGFMGAIPQLLCDATWSKILFALMPDVAAEIEIVVHKWQGWIDVAKLIPMMENNPVMAAFGMWRTKEIDAQAQARGEASSLVDNIQAFEWDVFVPTDAVQLYDDVLMAIGLLLQRKGDPAEATAELQRYEHELDVLANIMASRMLIAHGKGSDLFIENQLNQRQYAMVMSDKKTEYGGVMPGVWMDMFGRALILAGSGAEFEDLYGKTVREQDAIALREPALERPEAGRATFPTQLAVGDVVRLYKQIFDKPQFSVVLDIKTAALRSGAIARMISVMNLWGVHVLGVGSFEADQLLGLDEVEQSVGGEDIKGTKQIHFFHFAADFKAAVAAKKLPEKSDVMFNGGSLITSDDVYAEPQTYKVRTEVLRQVEALAKHLKLNLGLYVQEDDIAPAAVRKLDELVKAMPGLFSLGFAWGGLADGAADNEATTSSPKVGYSGQGILEYLVGTRFRWSDKPLTFSMRPHGEEGQVEGVEAEQEEAAPETQDAPVTVEVAVVSRVIETPGVSPADGVALGQVTPDIQLTVLGHEQVGDVVRVQVEQLTNLAWGVDGRGRPEATPGAATLDVLTEGPRAGMKQYWAMASDICPLPGINAPPMLAWWSREHIEAHEQVHLADMRQWLDANAKQLAEGAFTARTYKPNYIGLQLKVATLDGKNQIVGGLLDYMTAGLPSDGLSYYMQPGEQRAYAAGMPGLMQLAQQILAVGARLEAAERAKSGDGEVLQPITVETVDQTMGPGAPEGLQSAPLPVGDEVAAKESEADARFVHFVPGNLTIENSVVRGLDLDGDAFGAVRQEFAFTTVATKLVDGQPQVDAVLHVTYRWDVQARGSMQQSLDLVTDEPETLDPAYAAFKVWQVMESSLRPDPKNMPAFAPYWDEAEAIAHEQFHVTDGQAWDALQGMKSLYELWSLAAFESADETLDEAVVADKARSWAPMIADHYEYESNLHYLGGESDPGYANRPGEVRAYGARAPYLHRIADAILAQGRALSKGNEGPIAIEADAGQSEGPALMGGDAKVVATTNDVDRNEPGAVPGQEVFELDLYAKETEALGGFLRPRIVMTIGLTKEDPTAPPAAELIKGRILPYEREQMVKSGRQLVDDAASPLPTKAALHSVIEAGLRQGEGLPVAGYRFDILRMSQVAWKLTPTYATPWARIRFNSDRQPNLDIALEDGPLLTLTVAGDGELESSGNTTKVFDADQLVGIDTLVAMATSSLLRPQLAAGKPVDASTVVQLDGLLATRLAGWLAPYGLRFRLRDVFVLDGAELYTPPAAIDPTAKRFAVGEGEATIISSASVEQLAGEAEVKLPDGTVEVRGEFTYRLLEKMKENPKLSVSDCAELIMGEAAIHKEQHAEMLRLGDVPTKDEVGKPKAATPTQAKRYALVVGASNYRIAPDLPGAASDARNMTESLAQRGYAVWTLTEPSVAALEAELKAMIARVKKGDSVIVYYAGHGTDEFHKAGHGLLCSSDERVFLYTRLAAYVGGFRSGGVHCELVIDACHSGGAADLGERQFMQGAHHLDLETRGATLRAIESELSKLVKFVDLHRGRDLRARDSVETDRGVENRRIAQSVQLELEQNAAQFLEATGLPLFDEGTLRSGSDNSLEHIADLVSEAAKVARGELFKAMQAQRVDQKK